MPRPWNWSCVGVTRASMRLRQPLLRRRIDCRVEPLEPGNDEAWVCGAGSRLRRGGALLRGAGARGLAGALLGLLLRLEILAGLLVDDLHREAHLAAVVEPEQLDLDLVALLDDVGHLLHPARRELADV